MCSASFQALGIEHWTKQVENLLWKYIGRGDKLDKYEICSILDHNTYLGEKNKSEKERASVGFMLEVKMFIGWPEKGSLRRQR